MKRRFGAVLLALVLCLSLSACGEREDLMEVRIAYCSTRPEDGEALGYAARNIAVTDDERLCSLVLQLAMTEPEEESLTSVFPRRTAVRSLEISDQGVLQVDFSGQYAGLTGMARTLADACTVQTLFALGSVDGVEIRSVRISVEGEEVKLFTPASFVDSGDYLHLREYAFSIFFPNMTLGTLEADSFRQTLSDREQPAASIVDLLLRGQRSSGRRARLVSEDTVFYGLEIRSRVCYLNFNEEFLDTGDLYTGDSPLRLYAFVNSLCQLSYIDRVQFLIEGQVVTATQYENFDLPYAPMA